MKLYNNQVARTTQLFIWLIIICTAGAHTAIGTAPTQSNASASAYSSVALPPDRASVRLTVLDNLGRDDPTFNFHSVAAGQSVTHIFTLRNDTKLPVILDHVEPACGCTNAVVLNEGYGAEPRMLPGATARIRVTLDTSKIQPDTMGTLEGGTVEEDVAIFVEGQPVHAAATLRLTGRLTQGVAFDPPLLDFGPVDDAKGATRSVEVIYSPGLYAAGSTRLAASADSQIVVKLKPGRSSSSVSATGLVHKTYEVAIPPHALIGPLSGALIITGAATQSAGPSRAQIVFSLPYSGEIEGQVSAEPSLVVFGLIPQRDLYGRSIEGTAAQARRTRWIMLIDPALARVSRLANSLTRQSITTSKAANNDKSATFWRQADVQVDSPYFQATLVQPAAIATNADALASEKVSATADTAPPDTSGTQRASGSYRWLRLILLPSAPHGQPLSGQATVRFPDGESLVLPIQAEVQ